MGLNACTPRILFLDFELAVQFSKIVFVLNCIQDRYSSEFKTDVKPFISPIEVAWQYLLKTH